MDMLGIIGQDWETLPWKSEADPGCGAFKARLKAELQAALQAMTERRDGEEEDEGAAQFMLVIDRGVPLWAAELLLVLKRERPRMMIVCLVREGQEEAWPEPMGRKWRYILARCDQRIARDEWRTGADGDDRAAFLLECCDALLAVWDGRAGGVWPVIAQARRRGREVRILPPEEPGV